MRIGEGSRRTRVHHMHWKNTVSSVRIVLGLVSVMSAEQELSSS
jgi:hypothetical protein